MPKALTEPQIKELTLVFKTDPETGIEYAPRNAHARVLSVKGGEKKPSFIERVLNVLKGGEWPVSAEVADDVDNDGDGGDDYNELIWLLSSTYQDIQSCFGISDEMTRSMAMKVAIDGFKSKLDAIYAGDDDSEKAGARHSAADKATIDKLGEHLQAAKDAMDKASEAHAALMPADGDSTGDEDDDASKAAPVLDGVAGASDVVDPDAQPEVPAIPGDTAEADKAGEIDMTQEQLDALIASAAEKAAAAAVKATTDALQPQIDAANAAAETAKAAATAATEKAASLAVVARAPGAASSAQSPTEKALPNGTTHDPNSRLQNVIKAHMQSPAGRESAVI